MLLNMIKRFLGGGKSSVSSVEIARKMGVKVGENCHIFNTVIDKVAPSLISIGNNTTITNAKILNHDATTKKVLGYSKAGPVIIGDDCFIGWNTILLGPCKIGNKVIVGAGSVVTKNIQDNSVVCGNPIRRICSYDEYMNKMANKMKESEIYDTLNLDFSDKDLDSVGLFFIP